MNNITVLTATYNDLEKLKGLYQSLKEQTDQDFYWVVADGRSTDGTLDFLNNICDIPTKVTSFKDFGIYDALNRGIKLIETDYYIVAGSDDRLSHQAIELFKAELERLENSPDFMSAKIKTKSKTKSPKTSKIWLHGLKAITPSHSVGLLIKTNLHRQLGFYSAQFPICADQYFVVNSVINKASVHHANFVSGFYSQLGYSSQDTLGSLSEWYRIALKLRFNFYIQSALFMLRYLKNIKKIRRQNK